MIAVEAVLSENGRHVMFYVYRGDDLRFTHTQALPLTISEEAFEDCRAEWERSFLRLFIGNGISPSYP